MFEIEFERGDMEGDNHANWELRSLKSARFIEKKILRNYTFLF